MESPRNQKLVANSNIADWRVPINQILRHGEYFENIILIYESYMQQYNDKPIAISL